MAVRAPVRARGHGAGQRARCQCVAERVPALKARVLHARAWNLGELQQRIFRLCEHGLRSRVAQNGQGVVKGVVMGVTRASFGRCARLTPQLKRASAKRREEKDFRGVYMIWQVAAVHLSWGQAPCRNKK